MKEQPALLQMVLRSNLELITKEERSDLLWNSQVNSGSRDLADKGNIMCKGMKIKMDYLGTSSSFSISKAFCMYWPWGAVTNCTPRNGESLRSSRQQRQSPICMFHDHSGRTVGTGRKLGGVGAANGVRVRNDERELGLRQWMERMEERRERFKQKIREKIRRTS